ncbi:hypothetical protein FO519_009461 [Halicephalobus sp. NKZ332]|nr:hypothetical protein FO519_009461 [Halicephalobus sp. NKZ332]
METKGIIFLVLFQLCYGFGSSTLGLFNKKPRLNQDSACLVTSNLLYSHGYFVRELNPEEQAELVKYEQELDNYNKQLADFLHTTYISHPPAINWIYGSRVILPRFQQAMPHRPTLPSFCNGRDTAVYKMNGCVVQNYRIYIGFLYVRQLTDDERREMDEYEYRLKEYQNEIIETLKKSNNTWDSPDEPELDAYSWTEGEFDEAHTTKKPRRKSSTTTTSTPVDLKKIEKPKTSILPPHPPKFCSQLY